jgi:hypothetical protein
MVPVVVVGRTLGRVVTTGAMFSGTKKMALIGWYTVIVIIWLLTIMVTKAIFEPRHPSRIGNDDWILTPMLIVTCSTAAAIVTIIVATVRYFQ